MMIERHIFSRFTSLNSYVMPFLLRRSARLRPPSLPQASVGAELAMRFHECARLGYKYCTYDTLSHGPITSPCKIPCAAVVDGEIKDISLSDYKGKYVILFWYPKDFTFVCPTEIIAFSDRAKEFEKLNCQVGMVERMGIDTGLPSCHCCSCLAFICYLDTSHPKLHLFALIV